MAKTKSIVIMFGERVRELRKEKEISQEELADRAGVHRTYIGMIEREEKNITIVNIQKLQKRWGWGSGSCFRSKHINA